MTAPAQLGASIEEIARRVGPAVVGIGRGSRPGSGVVVGEGRVLTASRAADTDEVELVFADGRTELARPLAAAPDLGLGLLEVDTGPAPAVGTDRDGVPPPDLGTPVFALADPGGRGLRTTLGFVSSVGRGFRGPRGRRLEGAIEHTAPLPRGSSGGPLVDEEGRLLGLNVLRREGGLILAVPSGSRELDRLERIARGEEAGPPRLGVALAPAHVAQRLRRAVGLPERAGLLVRAVEPAGPAEEAGIARGDLLVNAAGRELGSVDDLVAGLEELSKGDSLELTLVRGEQERTLTVRFDGGPGDEAPRTPPARGGRRGTARRGRRGR